MATTINAYSVSLGMDAGSFIAASNLSRKEVSQLRRDIEQARDPMEQMEIEQNRLTKALNEGAISEQVYQRLLDSKRQKLIGVTEVQKDHLGTMSKIGNVLSGAKAAFDIVSGAVGVFVNQLRMVKELADEIDAVDDAAKKLGLSFKELSSLRFAGEELAGASAEQVEGAIKQMQIRMAKAMQGDTGLQKAFEQLGVNVGQAIQAGPTQSMMMIADGMEQIGSQSERLRLAAEVFGKGGTDIVGMLQEGRDALEEAVGFQSKWLDLSDAQVAGVGEANDLWGRILKVVDGLAKTFVAEIAPVFSIVFEDILGMADGLDGVGEYMRGILDTTVYLAGFFKDIWEISTLWHKTLYNIVTLNWSDIKKDVADAFDFSTGEKNLQALYDKRFELEKEAAEKKKKQNEINKAIELGAIEEEKKAAADAAAKSAADLAKQAADAFEKEKKAAADAAAKAADELAKQAADAFEKDIESSISAAQKYFEQERQRQMKFMEHAQRGPGGGVEEGSAEAARFMAQMANEAIGAAAMPTTPTVGEEQIATEAAKQYALMQEQKKTQDDTLAATKEMIAAIKDNGFARVR